MWPVLAVLSATCVAASSNHGTIDELRSASARTTLCRVVGRDDAAAAADAAAAGTSATAPTAYSAPTDRLTREKPPLPQLGAAGFTFRDPAFGSRLMRVTDARTRPGVVNPSFRVSSNAHLAAWNADSTKFYVLSDDGTSIPYRFDASTMTASRLQPVSTGNGGLTMRFYGEPQFSLANPNAIYGVLSGGNNHTIAKYDFTANTYATVVDLETFVGGLAGTYIGGLLTGGPTDEKLVTFFGGPQQDAHFYVMWSPVANVAARKLINTHSSTVNGVATATTLNFSIHSVSIDKSGRYVLIYPTAPDLGAPRYAAHVYVWDTQTDAIVPMTTNNGGHDAVGFGYSVNHDCCTSTTWDGMQFQFRFLANPAATTDLISPVLTPKEVYIDDHTTWNNARPDVMVPVISSTYRYNGNTAPWRAWDDEIIAIDTTGGSGGLVYRFAHHRSNSASDSDPLVPYFWYEPIANVSPDGHWVLFTSNWEKTLGKDASGQLFRQDVFLLELAAAGGSYTPPPSAAAPGPSSTSTPAPGPSDPSTDPTASSAPTPPAPASFTVTVSGSTVTLAWAPPGATPVVNYVIEAGSSSGRSDLAQLAVAGASTSLVVPDVARGVYYVRVRALNAAGLGTPSNEIVVAVGGASATQPPGTPGNLIATVEGHTVTLRWTSGGASSGFVIEAGSAAGRADLASIPTSATEYVATGVSPGVYFVRVRGSNGGLVGASSNEVSVIVQ
jgi:Fibronectin type III domain